MKGRYGVPLIISTMCAHVLVAPSSIEIAERNNNRQKLVLPYSHDPNVFLNRTCCPSV